MTAIGDSITYSVVIPGEADPTQLNFWLREAIDGTEFEWTYADSPVEGVQYPTGGNPITRSSAGHYALVWVARKAERLVGTWEASGTVHYSTTTTTLVRHSDVVAIDSATGANVLQGSGITGGNQAPRAVFNVEDYGAVARQLGDATSITDDERTANVVAIQTALNFAQAAGGGTVQIPNGTYNTNGAVGYDLTEDGNLDVTVQGLGGSVGTMLKSNNSNEPVFKLHTTTGNIRMVFLRDIGFLNGRTGLSCVRQCYCRHDRLFFWGSDQFAYQSYNGGGGTVLNQCYFTDSGFRGDAVLMFGNDIFLECAFGESSGGIVCLGGILQLHGGYYAGIRYRGKDYTDYWTDPENPATVSMAFFSGEDASVIASSADVKIVNADWGLGKKFLRLDGCYDVLISGGQYRTSNEVSETGFEGFIDVTTNASGRLALVVAGTQFQIRTGDSGFLVRETGTALLNNSIIQAQVILEGTASMTALSSSAPALLNPSGENNSVLIRTVTR